MKRTLMMAGNWKMNQSVDGLSDYLTGLTHHLSSPLGDYTTLFNMVLGVPFTMLTKAQELFSPAGIQVAAQTCHWLNKGAYTGEVSPGMLKEINISTCIVGHSERRTYYGETSESVALKGAACQELGLLPIICVGETKEERVAQQTEQVLAEQLKPVVEKLNKAQPFVIAYEPVWAIGTGLTASPEEAQGAHQFIRGYLEKSWGAQVAQETRILYGGSMNPTVTESLLEQPDIDGGLVGGASLSPESFAQMLEQTKKMSLVP